MGLAEKKCHKANNSHRKMCSVAGWGFERKCQIQEKQQFKGLPSTSSAQYVTQGNGLCYACSQDNINQLQRRGHYGCTYYTTFIRFCMQKQVKIIVSPRTLRISTFQCSKPEFCYIVPPQYVTVGSGFCYAHS